jgi:hypothetical protein
MRHGSPCAELVRADGKTDTSSQASATRRNVNHSNGCDGYVRGKETFEIRRDGARI